MLNFADINDLFGNCLEQCGLVDGRLDAVPPYSTIRKDEKLLASLTRTLEDIRTGADSVYERGKPAENTLGLDMKEWESRWIAWSAARSAAFHSRAALFMLGQSHYLDYLLQILRQSQNAVFLSNAGDVLQHTSRHYLKGVAEDLTRNELTDYWLNYFGVAQAAR